MRHPLRFTPGPPNLGLSKQALQVPQSSFVTGVAAFMDRVLCARASDATAGSPCVVTQLGVMGNAMEAGEVPKGSAAASVQLSALSGPSITAGSSSSYSLRSHTGGAWEV